MKYFTTGLLSQDTCCWYLCVVRCVYLSESLYVSFQYPPNCACWQAQSHPPDTWSELHAGTVLTLIHCGVYNRILSTQSNHLYTPWAYIPPWLLKEEGERLCCESERKKEGKWNKRAVSNLYSHCFCHSSCRWREAGFHTSPRRNAAGPSELHSPRPTSGIWLRCLTNMPCDT